MSIAIVPVTVPPSGDGPVASIANLVGAKTVTLTGFFQGVYTLLAGHNGSDLVPVLVFDSDGRESIKLTLPDAYATVRVRTGTNTVPSGAVTVTVAGLSKPGENAFANLATFAPGGGGASPILDTWALPFFPPTGLESEINIICAGGLNGSLVVEGSNDGANFGVVGAFQAGERQRPLLGLQQPLEFTPLSTGDNSRYLRFTVDGQVGSTIALTIGGRIPSAGGVGVPIQLIVTDSLDNALQGLGSPIVTILGPSSVVLGPDNTINPGDSSIVIVGSGNTVATGMAFDTLMGTFLTALSPMSTILGFGGAVEADSSESIVISGAGSIVRADSPMSVAIGVGSQCGPHAAECVAIGTGVSTIGSFGLAMCSLASNSALYGISIGTSSSVGIASDASLALGYTARVDAGITGSLAIGAGAAVNAASNPSTSNCAIGPNAHVNGNSNGCVAIGSGAGVNPGVDSGIAIGTSTSVSDSVSTAIGYQASSNGTGFNCSLGPYATISDATSGAVAIGTASVTVRGNNSVAIGTNASVIEQASISFGWQTTCQAANSVVIGRGSFIYDGGTPETTSTDSVAIGCLATVNVAASIVTAIESVAIGKTAAALSNYNVVIGSGATANGNTSIAIGQNSLVGGALEVILNGIALGQAASVHAANSMALGTGAVIHVGHDFSQVYGASAQTTRTNQVVFGSADQPIHNFLVARAGVGLPLAEFDDTLIVSNFDSAMRLLFKDHTGAIVALPVTVNAATGALTVVP